MSTVQPIPRFIEKATAFLQKDDRLKILGLFRVSGKRTDADILREELDQGNVISLLTCQNILCVSAFNIADITGKDIDFEMARVHPHIVATLLKLYLRMLPDTLFTSRLYPLFIEAIQGGMI